jgi:hypothetical protein
MSPSIKITAASISKKGHRSDENEDAWAVHREDDTVFVAVADGATESVYAGLWADALAQCLTDPEPWRTWNETGSPSSDAVRRAIDRARAVWVESVDEATAAASAEVPWYVTEKREEGAFATVLGIALLPSPSDAGERSGRLLAASVGDCGLFHAVSTEESPGDPSEFSAWPHDDPEAFTNRPELLSSRAPRSATQVKFRSDAWRPGDVFMLATDAVAAWLLRDEPALPESDEEADAWLRDAQSGGRLRNDDSTIVILRTNTS